VPMSTSGVPVAQYLRMSTDLQEHSLDNQAAAIAEYAGQHGFQIIKTYSDPAKSGLALKDRPGLRQLLNEVVVGTSEFKAILVYDVSRWGRFQDMDEAAHYEYLCKAAGIPVHYCAEQFGSDNTMAGLIMKALKRTMAGEYSRELGVKTLAGQRRIAQLGFKQGGLAGYGLRRMLLSGDGTPKQILSVGERKSLATDRVILVPGPPDEVTIIRQIYRMAVEGNNTIPDIVRHLNGEGVKSVTNGTWNYAGVLSVLTNPKYIGTLVFCKTAQRLRCPSIAVAPENWVVVPNAFEPIVTQDLFNKAQKVLENRTCRLTREQLLSNLRKLLLEKGRLSRSVIDACPYTPSGTTYQKHFGNISRAYELVGYRGTRKCDVLTRHRKESRALRQELIAKIVELFENDVQMVAGAKTFSRVRLRLRNRIMVSIVVSRSYETSKGHPRWHIATAPRERKNVTLLARLNVENSGFLDFHILPSIDGSGLFFIKEKDKWLSRGRKLKSLKEFYKCALRISAQKQTSR
jgi:DNA invertase Pin-like site-specific DNA recombinase